MTGGDGEKFNKDWFKNLDEEQIAVLTKNTPCIIIGQIINQGDTIMADNVKKTGDISDNQFGSNVNIQGDNVSQINIENEPEIMEALEKIKNEIVQITNEHSRNDADIYYGYLEKSIKERNTSKIETCISKLRTYIGDISSLMTIAEFFSLSIPGLG
ncbi:hypothetical protein GCM10008983_01570 [Lentibacillus halophilus]|uniref:Uncharacterized protein n=2 Tax=Lentibacillus halophilus TaxID=295065 RepID=A0ABN0Z2Q5_9BACI